MLRGHGLVHKHGLVKVLGRGALDKKLTVQAHAFSASARRRSRLRVAGSKCAEPMGRPRPPAKGNAHTNR